MATDNVTSEFYIDGAWQTAVSGTNLDERVRKNPGVLITRGASDQQGAITPSASDFEVNNRDGVFSNRNPSSVLYGKFPRYTKVRHSIPNAAGNLDSYVRFLQPNNAGTLSTTDKAGIEFAGDIDIRFEITPDTWTPVEGFTICGRYQVTGNNRVWMVWLDYLGRFVLRTSTNGTTTVDNTFAEWPATRYGRQAVRITLDVDSGGGNRTATLYYSDNIGGTWTQHSQIVTAGTTSIYTSSTAPLEVGNVGGGAQITNQTMMYGKIHAFELRNGIDGTLVANMSAASRAVGDTSWSDGLGNTWDITGTARIGTDRIRHTGEIDVVDYRWDETGRDAWMPLKSQGALNRLQETDAPAESPIYRNLIQYDQTAGYWPLEDGSSSTVVSSAAGTTSTSALVDCSFTGSVPTGLYGSSGSLKLNSTSSYFTVEAAGRSSTGENTILFYFRLATSSLPAANRLFAYIQTTGTIRRWEILIGPTGYQFIGYNSAGTAVTTDSIAFGSGGNPNGFWVGMQLTLSQVGANVNYTWRWWGVLSGTFWVHALGGGTYAGTVGRARYFTAGALSDATFANAEVAHLIMTMDVFSVNSTIFRDSSNGYNGELAGVRAARLASEEGITLEIYGDVADTQAMGPQTSQEVYNLIEECVQIDGGLLFDLRDKFGMGFRTRVDIENRNCDGFTVPYSSSYLSATPAFTEDGRYTKNIMTVSRPSGGSARATRTDGPLSISEPPSGIGQRPGSVSLPGYSDSQVQRLAEFQVWLRTQDELRTPQLYFELHRNSVEASTLVAERIIAAHLGDWLTLTGLPSFVSPDDRKLMILGYSERFNGLQWEVAFNVITADGYRTPRLNFAVLADSGTTTLNAGISSSATTMVLKTPVTSQAWIDSTNFASDFPLVVRLGGEVMTITALTTPSVVGSDYQQTATVTRSQNGVQKSHSAGDVVEVRDAYYIGM